MSQGTTALSLREARIEASYILDALRPHCERIEVAGSVRRGRPWVNDIEIVCIPNRDVTSVVTTDLFETTEERSEPESTNRFCDAVNSVCARKVKGNPKTGRYVQFFTASGVKVDLFMAFPENWGYIYLVRTGSADFSKMIAGRWVRFGYHGEEGMLTRNGQAVPFREEADLFAALKMRVPPPTEREMTSDGLSKWLIQ